MSDKNENTVKVIIDLRNSIVALIHSQVPTLPSNRVEAIASAAVKTVQVGLKVASGEYLKTESEKERERERETKV